MTRRKGGRSGKEGRGEAACIVLQEDRWRWRWRRSGVRGR
ncbi:hypothetical protein E2C01_066806 [Portunus trituberculatus]|uniref:Uncharacterized protein n=1 Tax=Portunus trituberculatus TaxID=210409 RepID=A0A5B7HTC0_PORTR|nr:hypothetical protein [Portunus trituberculatus]